VNKIWFEGKLHEGPVAISAHDRGLTLGDGIFETILVLNNVALWRKEHLIRMEAAAEALGISYPSNEISSAIDALISNTETHHALRLTLTRGAGGRGLAATIERSTFVATLTEFDPNSQFEAMTLGTSHIERNIKSPTSSFKTLSYMDQVMAAREAVERGYDEALMFNSKGRVACCSIGNIFLVIDGELVTPSLYEGILNGVMRNVIIQAASLAGIKVKQRLVRLADLDRAESMFATNSLRYIRAVKQLDDRQYVRAAVVTQKILPILHTMQQDQITGN
jgi:branched-chain amino acid aminotransferase